MSNPSWKHDLQTITAKGDCFLLGVTGGIATGKSTVAKMLEACGAVLIDFDDLAREVALPGEPAYQDIVACFGRQVLQPDKTLDRKKLRAIVFRDPVQREKLEGFIHPQVFRLFVERVAAIIPSNPQAVIQAVIPLMIELDLQGLFHKVLVVYASPEIQIRRVMTRDAGSAEEAAAILKNQLPIDLKVSCTDFLIKNDRSLEDTRSQVQVIWEKIKEIQQGKAG